MKNAASRTLPLLVVLLLFQSSCGYTRKVELPRGVKTIYVETFKNKVPVGELYPYEPGLEIKITNAILRRLHRDGNLQVAPKEKAGAVLEGDLIEFNQEGLRFSGLERVEEYRLYVVAALVLRDRKTRDVIWEEPNFSGDQSYFVLGSRAGSRSDAVDKAVERLARNVVDRIVEDW